MGAEINDGFLLWTLSGTWNVKNRKGVGIEEKVVWVVEQVFYMSGHPFLS